MNQEHDRSRGGPDPDRGGEGEAERSGAAGGDRSGDRAGRFDGNQGEGNREAAKAYNEGATRTARSGIVPGKAAEARDALDGPEGDELRDAEREGRSRAKGEDPQVKR